MEILSISQEHKQVSQKPVSWLLLSIALHALVLLIIEQPDYPLTGQPTLSIVIEEQRLTTIASTSAPQKAVNSMPIKQPKRIPSTKKKSLRKAAKVAVLKKDKQLTQTQQVATKLASPPHTTTTAAQVTPKTSDAQDSKASNKSRADEHNELKHRLQQALAHHFNYPRLARRRGWQGEVIVSFTLGLGGKIKDIRISSSSGHNLLDRAALTTLSKIDRISTAAQYTHSFELPVIYQLQDG